MRMRDKMYQRRRSEDDGGLDFFLNQKDLNLDFLEWDDIKNTRVGRKINIQLNKRDRDINDLKEKIKLMHEKH
jgi:hypothetical protein